MRIIDQDHAPDRSYRMMYEDDRRFVQVAVCMILIAGTTLLAGMMWMMR